MDLSLLVLTKPQFFYVDTPFSWFGILAKGYVRIYAATDLLLEGFKFFPVFLYRDATARVSTRPSLRGNEPASTFTEHNSQGVTPSFPRLTPVSSPQLPLPVPGGFPAKPTLRRKFVKRLLSGMTPARGGKWLFSSKNKFIEVKCKKKGFQLILLPLYFTGGQLSADGQAAEHPCTARVLLGTELAKKSL